MLLLHNESSDVAVLYNGLPHLGLVHLTMVFHAVDNELAPPLYIGEACILMPQHTSFLL